MGTPLIFISSVTEDEFWQKRLATHLDSLTKRRAARIEHAGKAPPGADLEDHLARCIADAAVGVVLLSADYLADDEVRRKQLSPLRRRHDAGEILLIPILVRPCPTDFIEELDGLRTRPGRGKPLTALDAPKDEHALTNIVREIAGHLGVSPSGAAAHTRERKEHELCEAILQEFERMAVHVAVGRKRTVQSPVEDVFVDLSFTPPRPDEEMPLDAPKRRWSAERAAPGHSGEDEAAESGDLSREEHARRRDASLADRPADPDLGRSTGMEWLRRRTSPGLVLLGDPGCGKTTLLWYLTALTARERLDAGRGLIPVFASLLAYDSALEERRDLPLLDFLIEEQARRCAGASSPSSALHKAISTLSRRAMKEGGCLFLLDGLDEVGAPNVNHVAKQISLLARSALKLGNRLVVTSRVVGYSEAPIEADIPGLELRRVQSLDHAQREELVRKWYAMLSRRALDEPAKREELARESESLARRIAAIPVLQRLASTPWTLTMLIALRREHGELPVQRTELYHSFAKLILEDWPRDRSADVRRELPAPDASLDRRMLQALALWMLRAGHGNVVSEKRAFDPLIGCLLEYDSSSSESASDKQRDEAGKRVRAFLEHAKKGTEILIPRGPEGVAFRHRTLLELFAGMALAEKPKADRWAIIEQHLHRPAWRLPIVFCAGALRWSSPDSGEAEEIVHRIADAGSRYEALLHRDLFLAAEAATEAFKAPVGGAASLSPMFSHLEQLARETGAYIQNRAIDALIGLVTIGHRPSVDLLRATIERGWLVMLARAGFALAMPDCERVVRALQRAIRSKKVWHVEVRWLEPLLRTSSAFRAWFASRLGKRGALDARFHWWGSEHLVGDLPELRAALLRAYKRSASRQAALSLLAKGAADKREVRRLLKRHLDDPNSLLRKAARRGLRSLVTRSKRYRTKAIEILQEADPEDRKMALEALEAVVNVRRDARKAVVTACSDDAPEVAQRALQALESVAPLRVREEKLRAHLKSPHASVRQAALSLLRSSRNDSGALRAEVERLWSDPERAVRIQATLALAPASRRYGRTERAFRTRLRDQRVYRLAPMIDAVASLAFRDDVITNRLLEALAHDSPEARTSAIAALAPFAARPAVLPRLLASLEDANPAAVSAAAHALAPHADRRKVLQRLLGALSHRAVRPDKAGPALVQTLARMAGGTMDVRTALLAAMDAPSHELRLEAAKALAPHCGSDPRIDCRFLRELEALGSADALTRARAAQLLSPAFAHDAAIQRALRPRFIGGKWTCSPEVASVLSENVHVPGVPELLEALARHDDGRILSAVHEGLLKLSPPPPTPESDLLTLIREESACSTPGDQVNWGLMHALKDLRACPLSRNIIRDVVPVIGSLQWEVAMTAIDLLTPVLHIEPSVEKAVRALLDNGSVQHRASAAAALASVLARDRGLGETLVDWLACRGDEPALTVRRKLADGYGPILRAAPPLKARVVRMLEQPAWEARQGAAWALIRMGLDDSPELWNHLRGLLRDDRGEESWWDRLDVAGVLLDYPRPDVRREAVQTACEALAFGRQPWFAFSTAWSVRGNAAHVLGKLDPIHADDALLRVLAAHVEMESEDGVRNALLAALEHLAAADPAAGPVVAPVTR